MEDHGDGIPKYITFGCFTEICYDERSLGAGSGLPHKEKGS